MTGEVPASLLSIESSLQNLGRTVLLRSLRPGLTGVAIQRALVEAGLTATPELELVYGWRNGTSTAGVAAIDDIHIFPGYYFLSLEDRGSPTTALLSPILAGRRAGCRSSPTAAVTSTSWT